MLRSMIGTKQIRYVLCLRRRHSFFNKLLHLLRRRNYFRPLRATAEALGVRSTRSLVNGINLNARCKLTGAYLTLLGNPETWEKCELYKSLKRKERKEHIGLVYFNCQSRGSPNRWTCRTSKTAHLPPGSRTEKNTNSETLGMIEARNCTPFRLNQLTSFITRAKRKRFMLRGEWRHHAAGGESPRGPFPRENDVRFHRRSLPENAGINKKTSVQLFALTYFLLNIVCKEVTFFFRL